MASKLFRAVSAASLLPLIQRFAREFEAQHGKSSARRPPGGIVKDTGKHYVDPTLTPYLLIRERGGNDRVVYEILKGRTKYVREQVVDQLLVAMDRTDAWHTEDLKVVYVKTLGKVSSASHAPSKEARNCAIVARLKKGERLDDVALAFQLSPGSVARIARERGFDFKDPQYQAARNAAVDTSHHKVLSMAFAKTSSGFDPSSVSNGRARSARQRHFQICAYMHDWLAENRTDSGNSPGVQAAAKAASQRFGLDARWCRRYYVRYAAQIGAHVVEEAQQQ